MNMKSFRLLGWISVGIFSALTILVQAGCQTKSPCAASAVGVPETQSPIVTSLTADQPGMGQKVFPSAQSAGAALLAAVKAQNHAALHRIFGPALKQLVSGDKVEDHRHFEKFVAHAKENFELKKKNADTYIVHIGNKSWPFPIPIAQLANGQWFFDTQAGMKVILTRRIGRDELETITVCRAYVIAQRQYTSVYHDSSNVLRYAQRFVSKPGKQDGLYWPAAKGQPESPFGALAAKAATEGYTPGKHKGPRPFYGYFYRILKQQGPAAPGGAYNYVINGNMIAGFALVAFPAKYGSSGVMTFMVNQDGKVYQKDMGPDTTRMAWKMMSYNPDKTWTLVKP